MTMEEIEPSNSDTHFEIELDPDEDRPVPGRPPVYVDVTSREETRKPIIPATLRGAANIKATARYHAASKGHSAGFHAVRTPRYTALFFWRALSGLFVVLGRVIRWWWVSEQTGVRHNAALDNDGAMWHRLHKEAKVTRAWRGSVLLFCAIVLVVALYLVHTYLPRWSWPFVALSVLTPLVVYMSRGKPIITGAVVTPRFRRLNTDIVLRAYIVAKLCDPLDKPGGYNSQMFASTMARDPNQLGSQVTIDLPHGKGFHDAVKAKPALASGLDVTEFQVYLTRDKSSDRRHTLYVADQNPLAIPAGRTDMLDCKPRDIWEPIRFGLNERGKIVPVSLLWHSFLVGAQPRKGKTFSARLAALHAALDPWVKLFVVDGKNSTDWDQFALVADVFIKGSMPTRRGNPVERFISLLESVKQHIEDVGEILSSLPVSEVPEGKLTRELARDRRYPELRVWMLIIEEFQTYFETQNKEDNARIADLLSRIIALGPAAGVIVVSASQKPSGIGAGDVGRLFNRYRDQHDVRFALRCGNRVVSEAVLGGDAYQEGYDASALPIGDEFRGVGYLYGLTDETPTVRTFLADGEDAQVILRAARAHREAAGTLSGMAAGEEAAAAAKAARDVLADVLHVWSYVDRPALAWRELAPLLAEHIPAGYAETRADDLAKLVRAAGVSQPKPTNVKLPDGSVSTGVKRADVQAAVALRQIESGS